MRRYAAFLAIAWLALTGAMGLAAATPPRYDPDAVAAIVNNQQITVGDLGSAVVSELGFGAIDDMVRRTIVEREAQRLGITVTDDEMAARRALEARLRMFHAAETTRLTLGELEAVLKRQGKSLDEERIEIEKSVPTGALRAQLLAEKICMPGVQVTEEDVEERYRQTRGLRYIVAHILVDTRQNAEAALLVLTRPPAGVVEISFEQMVRDASLDRDSVEWGGRMQPLTPDTKFGRLAAGMKPGEIKLAASRAGWHLIKLQKRCEPEGPPLAEIRDQVRQEATVIKVGRAIDAWMVEVVEKAKVFYNVWDAPADRQVLGVDVAAYVNGLPIWRGQLADALLDQFGKDALKEQIDKTLVFQYAAQHGMDVSPATLESRIDEMVDRKIADLARQRGLTAEQFMELLGDYGINLAHYRRTVQSLFISRSRVRAYIIAEDVARKAVTVSDEEVRAEYESEYGPRTFVLDIAQAGRDMAERLRREAAQGADFKQLIKDYGLGTGLSRTGGRRGPITPKDEYWPIVSRLKLNDVSDVFKASDGLLHIVKVVERTQPEKAPSFEEARPAMEEAVRRRKMNLWTFVWLDDLRRKASIQTLMFN